MFFRRLTSGINFDTQKFSKEATKFGLIKKVKDEDENQIVKSNVPLPSMEEVKKEIKEKVRKEKLANVSDEDESQITVLGNIKTTQKKKKKKKTKTKIREAYTERLNQFRNAHNIHVTGTDVADPVESWAQLTERCGLAAKLVACIPHTRPTPIQVRSLTCGDVTLHCKWSELNDMRTLQVVIIMQCSSLLGSDADSTCDGEWPGAARLRPHRLRQDRSLPGPHPQVEIVTRKYFLASVE